MKRNLLLLITLFFFANTFAQKQPKLIVGIVIDQMRYDYLYSYWNKYSENGFKKLMKLGYNCKNTNYNYVPTYTAPGHASIYTGTTPSVHGIIGNDWYDRITNGMVYCTDDEKEKTIGSTSDAGKMSPRRMLSTTIGDELRIASGSKSKVIGIALKDRSAILPAGHSANAAYWFDNTTGNFITSSYYMKELPKWLQDFNAKKLADHYLSQIWNTLLPIEQYTESIADDNPYEALLPGEKKPVFPHNLPEIAKTNEESKGIIKITPFGNSITKDLAIATLAGENLGKGATTDMLCISFSSPDYIGHNYGPKSVEQEDCYIRLDRDIAELITYLEKNYGKDQFVLFLTADHAAVDVPEYLKDQKIPAGYIFLNEYVDKLNNFLLEIFPLTDPSQRFIKSISNGQVFFNLDLLKAQKIDREKIEIHAADFFRAVNGISNVITRHNLLYTEYNNGIRNLLQNGFNEIRSGDLVVNLQPAWTEYGNKGTTHGSPYSYDTHVPLIWYGLNIPKGSTTDLINITDIAPTLSIMLNIPYPNGTTGKVIQQIVK